MASPLALLPNLHPSAIGGIEFDAAMIESHSYTASVTQYPVETGATISDHTSLDPISIRIEGVFSDTPIPSQLLLKAAKNWQSGGTPTFVLGGAATQWGLLVDLWEARAPLTVVTELEEYENMVITALSTARTAEAGKSLFVLCDMQQVVIVDSDTTLVPATSPLARKKKGKKPEKKSADETGESKKTSIFRDIVQFASS